MKRILIFSLAYHPHVGGAEIALKELTKRIPDTRFHLITLNLGVDAQTETIENVEVHRVGKNASYLGKILFVPRAALLARRLHKEHHFDALWAMMTYMVWPITLLRFMGVKVPYVITLQDGDPFLRVFRRWFIRPFVPLLRYGFAHASGITVLSQHLASWVQSLGGPEPVVIPNGVDVARFKNATPTDIGKKDGETWLVTSSRLVHKNAVDDVIRALALLPESVKFLVCGTGADEAMLKRLARELGVEERVVFRGNVSHEELPGLLAASDMFIRPSRTEGFGSSFVEAMAVGVPVIATQEGGIADFLFDATRNPEKPATGFAVDADAPEQIAEMVRYMETHKEEVQETAVRAQRMVEERYDWDLITKNMHGIFTV